MDTVKPEQIEILEYSVDHGDPNDPLSSGSFNIKANTPKGILKGIGKFDSGNSIDEEYWSLNGEELDRDLDLPDLEIPHARMGKRDIRIFDRSRDEEAKIEFAEFLNRYIR